MEYSEPETAAMAELAYRGLPVRCPRCNASVRCNRYHAASGTPIMGIMFSCERCKNTGHFADLAAAEMRLEYTREEKIRIREQYWARGAAACPHDGALLYVEPIKTIFGGGETPISVHCERCGRYFQSDQIEEQPDPETYEGKYLELSRIGGGGMGEVFLATKRGTGETVAVKRIRRELLNDPDSVRRFQREAKIAMGVQSPFVVKVHEFFLDERGGILVMDYLPGGDLATKINDRSVPDAALVSCFEDVVSAVEALHSAGIVHRDLKSGNVLLDESSRAHLSDFGLAVLVERTTTPLTATGNFVGTAYYAAPEQRTDAKSVGPPADIWALGLIAYEIVTREAPYPSPIILRASAAVNEAIGECLDPKAGRRPANGRRLLAALIESLKPTGDA